MLSGAAVASALVVAWTSMEQCARTEQRQAGEFTARASVHPRIVYSVAAYQANEGIEDRYDVRETAAGDVMGGVFDGHGGWQVAEYVRNELPRNLEKEFENMAQPADANQVEMALVRAFERTDRAIMYRVHAAFEMGLGNVGRVGACAVMALIKAHRLYVANAGDCRAVLGKVKADGSIEAVAMSEDHNAKLPKEQELLKSAHPNEVDIIRCKHPGACYVKGRLQPTRALGDAYLKYPEFNGRRGLKDAGRYIAPPYTPPYITARPDVSTVELDPSCRFVILATDGIWDLLDNQTAARVVSEAVEAGDTVHAGQRLVDAALVRKALELEISVDELRAIPAGKKRRSTHDDMTVVVLVLKEEAMADEDERELRKRLSYVQDDSGERQQ